MRDCVETTAGVELLRIMLEVDWMLGTATPKKEKVIMVERSNTL